MSDNIVELLWKVQSLMACINELHGKLVGWVKARISQKYVEGRELPTPDPEEHRLLAWIDQVKADARETIEEALRGTVDPEIRERLLYLRDGLAEMHIDLDLTITGEDVK